MGSPATSPCPCLIPWDAQDLSRPVSCGAPGPIPWENLIMGLPQLRRGRREEEEGSEEGKICSAWALCHTSGRETEARGAQRPWLGQIPAAVMDKGGPIRVLLLPLSLALVIGEGGEGKLGAWAGHGDTARPRAPRVWGHSPGPIHPVASLRALQQLLSGDSPSLEGLLVPPSLRKLTHPPDRNKNILEMPLFGELSH